ncbi:MAG: alpha-glucan family phosphorylase [Phycisphaerales bacterium]|nr:alpha-glucan family phosphorylase [Phycisphaerales bacterium]
MPESLEPLRLLAHNLWWAWNPPATDLFRRLDPDLWEAVGHNPVALLGKIRQEKLEKAARDGAFTAQLCRVMDQFYVYMESRTWFSEQFGERQSDTIAYFSAEFGLHESLPIYSGGLGVLAGDHLKSASDLGLPLVGIGLMYRQGYFEQQVTQDGQQLDVYPSHDFHTWPAALMRAPSGGIATITVPIAGHTLTAQIWQVKVGRVRLLLLDADLPENPPELRAITHRLYGGDQVMRIRQEVLLGVGGMRALKALGIRPVVCHMNEGHAAFLALERIREAMADLLSFHEAIEATSAGNIFTTHTPVPAGIDRFEVPLVEEHLAWMARELGISLNELLGLGRENPGHLDEPFCMAILALRLANRSNGVSRLHGEVSRGMFQSCWPGVPKNEVPITHVTNGIHLRSWVSAPMYELLEQYLGPTWADGSGRDEDTWERVSTIPDPELWRVHERRRERLVTVVRKRLREELRRRGASPADIKLADEVLDPTALTIGFARRFAPYKRATLLLRNPERLAALLNNSARPIQFIFAGKAHPRDGAGKELIKQICAAMRKPEFRRRIVFLENYDINLGRELVHGVDVWLNNPLRPLEASGTSGMKVPANGGLNCSALDGWWIEGYNGENGWAIGDGREYDDRAYQDHVESDSLYNLLESEIVPMFFDRTDDGLPRRWLSRVRESMRSLCPVFNTNRMVREYTEQLYIPTAQRFRRLGENGHAGAKQLSRFRAKITEAWHQVRVIDVTADADAPVHVGESLQITARVHLGTVRPDDVLVEVLHAATGSSVEFDAPARIAMTRASGDDSGDYVYRGAIPCTASGQHGYAVRVVPHHEDLPGRYDPGIAVWG